MDKNWTDRLPDLLQDYQEAPPEGLWDAVRAGVESRRRRLPAAFWYAAAGLAAAAAIAWFVFLRPVSPKPAVTLVPGELAAITIPEIRTELSAFVPSSVRSLARTRQIPNEVLPVIQDEYPPVTLDEDTPVIPSEEFPVMPGEAPSVILSEAKESPITEESPVGNLPVAQQIPPESVSEPRRTFTPGVQITLSSSGPSQHTADVVNGYGLPSALFTKADASGPSAEFRMVGRNKPSTTNSSYTRLPRWALGVNMGFTRRLSLESGVVLSPLRTTLTTEAGSNRIETRKDQYYLGIPLHLQYSFWQGRRLGLYVTGGPMYQFAVASRVRTTAEPLSGGSVQTLEEDNSLLRDALWSVDLSAGVQYRIFRRGSLFVQPGVSWYFPRADAPDNFYSAHSTTFELTFGYRLRLF